MVSESHNVTPLAKANTTSVYIYVYANIRGKLYDQTGVICSSQRSRTPDEGEKTTLVSDTNRIFNLVLRTWKSFVEDRVSGVRVQVESHLFPEPINRGRRITGGQTLQHGIVAHFDGFVGARSFGDHRESDGQIFFCKWGQKTLVCKYRYGLGILASFLIQGD